MRSVGLFIVVSRKQLNKRKINLPCLDIKSTNILVSLPSPDALISTALSSSPDPFAEPLTLPLPVYDDPIHMHFKLMDFGHCERSSLP